VHPTACEYPLESSVIYAVSSMLTFSTLYMV